MTRGRTTFLRSLALTCAGEAASLGLGRRLPVLLPLSAYANATARRDITLGRFLSRYFEERELELPLAALFEERLARGELLLLLDGLDEVRERRRRTLVVERVKALYNRRVRKRLQVRPLGVPLRVFPGRPGRPHRLSGGGVPIPALISVL